MAEDLASKGKRALISILQSLSEYGNLSKTAFFKIFDTKVCPMLLYGSELWGLKQFECIEKIHYDACKRFIKVPLKTCNFGILRECGRYPLYIETAKKVLKYWIKILHMQNDRYVKNCLNIMLHYDNFGCTNWVSNVKKILSENGFGYIWENQHIQNENVFLQRVE